MQLYRSSFKVLGIQLSGKAKGKNASVVMSPFFCMDMINELVNRSVPVQNTMLLGKLDTH